jgi:peptidoglycan hydrolase-like protein with peptidoglycan-binding domain
MSNLKNILQSFQLKDELNPKIWEKSKNDKYSMRPKVRTHLLEVAYDFIDSLGVDIIVSDIVMTGSLANYNWSNYSDVDIHIISDFNQFPNNTQELYDELFRLRKTVYALKRKISIFGYDVEMYVEDESIKRDVQSAGRFSLLMDEWLVEPSKESVDIKVKDIQEKAKKWMSIIDGVEESIQDEDIETAKKLIEKYTTKIRKFRECGLEKGGEYSDENLVFKILRRNGYLEKIREMKDKLVDKKLSLKEGNTNIGGTFKTDLENGPKNHGGRALGNWESDNAWDIFSPPGTVVNAYTDGTVTRIRDTGKNSGKIYGTQVSIKGNGEFPDIFYTHLKNVKLQKGDEVKVGDYIGEISEWLDHENMTHVHIGLPKEHHLRELLVNSDKIFSGSKGETQTPEKTVSTEKTDSTFISDLQTISSSGKEYKNLKSDGGKIPYDKDVEKIQTSLQLLGYSLPKWGVDGLFGPETEIAVKKFEEENGITSDGKLNDEDLKKMTELMISKGFKESDLSKVQTVSDFDKVNVGSDKQFYESILTGIGAPITEENLKFFYAWRKGEGGKATNNPFNTTFKLSKDSDMSNYNKAGVKNYSTPNYGIEATVKTLQLPYYTCITDGLKNDIGADKISKCDSLKTWGTGDLVAKVLSGGEVTPPQIYA